MNSVQSNRQTSGGHVDNSIDAREVTKVVLLRFTWSIILLQAVMTPFFIEKRLSLSDIFYLQSTFALALLLSELPTGVISDIFGRRAILITAAIFRGAGATSLVLLDGFWGMAVAYTFIALGNSALSGSDVSAIVDRYRAVAGSTRTLDFYLARLRTFSLIAAATSAVIGGLIASQSLMVAGIANCIIAWAALPIALTISPLAVSHYTTTSSITPRAFTIVTSSIEMLRSNSTLRLAIITTSMLMLLTVSTAYSYQIRWLELGFDPVLMGLAFAAQSILGALGAYAIPTIRRRISPAELTTAGAAMAFAALVLAIPVSLPLNLISVMMLFLTDGIATVVLLTLINDIVPSDIRATANSSVYFVTRVLTVCLGPVMAYSITIHGTSAPFIVVSLLALITFIFAAIPLSRLIRDNHNREY